jgi:hypothetical protein
MEISGPTSLGTRRAFFLVARGGTAVADGQILQLALAALVADRAIQRVVDQQEFHHAFCALTALSLAVRTIMPLSPAWRRRAAAWGLFHFDQAHAAVGRDGQFLVIAEVRDVGADLVGSVHHHAAFRHFNLLAVYFDFNHGCRF